jgi:hypothetical protein
MVAAVALESVVKLLAFGAVGLFVTYGLYDGFGDVFAREQFAERGEVLAGVARERRRAAVVVEVGGDAPARPVDVHRVEAEGVHACHMPRDVVD